MKHTLSVVVEDRPGALTRITTMFARRGFNIESLAVGPTERPGVSCITLRVDCTQHSLEQIEKQIHKLVNVLRGEMSLVGPRPALPSEVSEYDRRELRRLAVTPGLSGLWQVSGRSNLGWADGIRLDLYYVENWSMTQDLQILWRTAKAVLTSDGAY